MQALAPMLPPRYILPVLYALSELLIMCVDSISKRPLSRVKKQKMKDRTMNAMVVYASKLGNTERIAKAHWSSFAIYRTHLRRE